MLVHEPMSMSLSRWTWAWEHNQIFLKIFFPRQWNISKIFFDTSDRIFGDVEEYFVMCSWMIDFLDENGDEKLQWMNFFMNIGNKLFFVKTNFKNRMEEI